MLHSPDPAALLALRERLKQEVDRLLPIELLAATDRHINEAIGALMNENGDPLPDAEVACEALESALITLDAARALAAPQETPQGASDTLDCPCCGDDGAVADARGEFYDGQPLICGCRGLVSVDEDMDPWINISDEPCPADAKCRKAAR